MKKFVIYSEELEHGKVYVKAEDLDKARAKALELLDIQEVDKNGEIIEGEEN